MAQYAVTCYEVVYWQISFGIIISVHPLDGTVALTLTGRTDTGGVKKDEHIT